jgi:hypothetical protein
MSHIYPLFSKRNKIASHAIEYDILNDALKNQIWHITDDFFGSIQAEWPAMITIISERLSEMWKSIYAILCREYGLEKLPQTYSFVSHEIDIEKYFKGVNNIERQLDILEIICTRIEKIGAVFSVEEVSLSYTRKEALSDINTRLQEHGIGYRYQDGEIIKVPSEFTYDQAIQPALILLHQKGFENAQEEFLSAFEHYKKGAIEYEAALTACLKSVESTIKIIATTRKWAFNQNDTAKPLIALVIKEGLVPTYSESFLAGVRNTLESGIPTLRNKLGGHGKGAEVRIVDEASMHYCINLTAAVILYLVQRHQELP